MQLTRYLTYEEYNEYGGTFDEATFNELCFEAESYIDWYTFNRLRDDTEVAKEVKICVFFLIKKLKNANDLLSPNKGGADGTITGQVSQMSNDGVTVQYATMQGTEIYYNTMKEVSAMLDRTLCGVTNQLGRKLLYRGLYPGE